jgi:hypothetical protein
MKCGKGSAFLVLVVTANLSFGSLQQEDTVNNHSVVQLVCRDIVNNVRTTSLGTLLSTDPKLQSEADIAIVTAHGQTVEREYCHVSFNTQTCAMPTANPAEHVKPTFPRKDYVTKTMVASL